MRLPVLVLGAAVLLPGAAAAQVPTTNVPPTPAVPPPVSVTGRTAAQSPTNPPEVVAPPAGIAAPPMSAPLTGSGNGALAGSDQVNPPVSGGNRP